MRTPAALAAVVLAVLLAPAPAARAEKPRPAANPLPAWIAAFGDALYGEARREPGNVFLSPFSVHAALSMAREGAAGETAAEMDAVLRLPADGAGDAYVRLVAAMKPRTVEADGREVPAYELNVANALWAQEGFPLDASFVARLRDSFASPETRVDFTDPARAREVVNAWVARETREKIREILPEGMPTPDTRLVLTNAVHFKASWQEPFSDGATQPDAFHRLDGTTVTVPMMRRTGPYPYRETPDAQVLELPYAMGDLSMFVVLPKARGGLPAIEERTPISAAVGEDAPRRLVAVTLPKFTFTWGGDLTRTLARLGIRKALDPRAADFSRMTAAERLFVGVVLHKAFVAVDEKGTEAAAVTAVAMAPTAAPGEPPRPIEFRADHPFRFVIVHRATGTILFAGRVADPS
jgi:serpin B